jgi:hypothetical protein
LGVAPKIRSLIYGTDPISERDTTYQNGYVVGSAIPILAGGARLGYAAAAKVASIAAATDAVAVAAHRLTQPRNSVYFCEHNTSRSEGIKGVADIAPGGHGEDVKLRFSLHGIPFVVVEPWNDSSEYVITPCNERTEATFQGLHEIELHFSQHEVALLRCGAGWTLKVVNAAVLFPALVLGKGIAYLKRRKSE